MNRGRRPFYERYFLLSYCYAVDSVISSGIDRAEGLPRVGVPLHHHISNHISKLLSMLIEETHKDVPTKAAGSGSMRTLPQRPLPLGELILIALRHFPLPPYHSKLSSSSLSWCSGLQRDLSRLAMRLLVWAILSHYSQYQS